MELTDTMVAMLGVGLAIVGFAAIAELVRRSESRRNARLIQAFVFGLITGFSLALVILYFGLRSGSS